MSEIYNGTFVLGNTSATTISAGPGIKIDDSTPGVIKVSNDETVLWEGNLAYGQSTQAFDVSISNFERVRLVIGDGSMFEFDTSNILNNSMFTLTISNILGNFIKIGSTKFVISNNGTVISHDSNLVNQGTGYWANVADGFLRLVKVVGINRISGGN